MFKIKAKMAFKCYKHIYYVEIIYVMSYIVLLIDYNNLTKAHCLMYARVKHELIRITIII